jgi:1,4-dihydroxy-2-naphthoyl-CoA hydrolase
MTDPPPDLESLTFVNAHLGGYNRVMGLSFTRVGADEVEGELTIAEQHLQPYGIVHGGVHTGLIEAACSTGAAVFAMKRGQSVVGLENSTSFLRAAREGKLRVRAVPVTRGRRSQVWEATVRDERGRALATGRVRLLCLEPGEALAGKTVGV